MKKIYVGNLSHSTTEEALREAFAAHGVVESVAIVMDRYTGRSRGFGFIEMADPNEAAAAIQAMDGTELDGRTLTVNEARPKAPSRGGGPGRGPGGGRGGQRGGGGGRGRGGRTGRRGGGSSW